MAQIKFRVEDANELNLITEAIDYQIDGKKTIRSLIEQSGLTDCDLQLVDKVIIVTGNVSIRNTNFSIYNSVIPLYGFEINGNDVMKVVFDCSKIALPSNVNNVAFQVLIER